MATRDFDRGRSRGPRGGVARACLSLVRDDRQLAGRQSGLLTAAGSAKPSYRAFALPLAQRSRSGLRTVLWGQVRPRVGRQPYRLEQLRGGPILVVH